MPVTLPQILESNFQQLVELAKSTDFESRFVKLYAGYLVTYHQGDSFDISSAHSDANLILNDKLKSIFLPLLRLRYAVRNYMVDLDDIEELAQKINDHDLEDGEAHFVLGLAHSRNNDMRMSSGHFHRAHQIFENFKCEKKALIALHNQVLCDSLRSPQTNFVRMFTYISERAAQLGDSRNQGLAFMNICSQYLKHGALDVALEFAEKAVGLFNDSSLNYYETLVNRAYVNFLLGKQEACLKDLDRCVVAPFPEIKELIKVFNNIIKKTDDEIDERLISQMWQDRLRKENSITSPLGDLERKVVELLLSKPCDKQEIISTVYAQPQSDQIENRLRVLLSRVRKKISVPLKLRGGKYYFSDPNKVKQSLATS